MKIALFTETYTPDVNGVVTHVRTLKNGLEAQGHEVLVVHADKHCKHHYVQDGSLHCPSVSVKRFYGFGVVFPYSRKRLKLIHDFNPDIVHIHHEFGIGLSGIMYAKMYNKPLVYTLHTMYDQYMYYIAPRPLIKTATKVSHHYERFIAKSATILTGPSQKCDGYFKRIGVKKEVNIIPNSADLDMFDYTKTSTERKAELKRGLGIPEGSTVVCFAARLGKEKSVDVLLEYFAESVKEADGFHLLIIGGGPEEENLKTLAKNLGINGKTTFTGQIKHESVPEHFAICDIFATASLSEMNSISMLESMASGLVVLQRYDELNADQIKSGVNGYFFNTREDFTARLQEIKALSSEGLAELKATVRSSVVNRGASDLSAYMLGVYAQAIEVSKKVQELAGK